MKTYLFNPFVKIAGLQAFLIGSLFLALSFVFSYLFKGLYDGVIDFHFVDEISISDSLFCLLIDLASLLVVFYPLGLILNKGKVRFIDILGTFTFARFPLVILPLTNINNYHAGIVQKILHAIESKVPIQLSGFEIVFLIFSTLILFAVLIWFIALLYKAFTTSANLKGTKAIISFIAGLILAEILSKIAIFTFLN